MIFRNRLFFDQFASKLKRFCSDSFWSFFLISLWSQRQQKGKKKKKWKKWTSWFWTDADQLICIKPFILALEILLPFRSWLLTVSDSITGRFQTEAALLFSSLFCHQCSSHARVKQIFIFLQMCLAGAVYSVRLSIFLCDIGIHCFFVFFFHCLFLLSKLCWTSLQSSDSCFHCLVVSIVTQVLWRFLFFFFSVAWKDGIAPRKFALVCRSLFLSLKAPLSPARRLFLFMQIEF